MSTVACVRAVNKSHAKSDKLPWQTNVLEAKENNFCLLLGDIFLCTHSDPQVGSCGAS